MTNNTNKKIIISLTGQIASGKDVIKKYLEKKYGAKSVKFSQILRDVLFRLNIPIERTTMQDLSTLLRQSFGEDLFAKIIAEDAKKLDSDIVVVDGARRLADITEVKKLEGFVLIRVDAEPEIRYQRNKIRNENIGDAEKTFEDFLNDHKKESEDEIPLVMESATEKIDNNGSLDDLYKQVEDLIEKLKEN
jgi:dephospho-CoA kinase